MADASRSPLAQKIAQGLNKVSLALRAREWIGAGLSQVSPTQGQILSRLAAHGPMRLSKIAEELAVSLPTISDAVATLVEKKLVEKRKAADDGRAQLVHLTGAGARMASQTAQWPDFLALAVDVLSEEEQLVFHRALIKMIRTMQDRGEIPVARMCVSCSYFRPAVHQDPLQPHHCNYVDAAFGDASLRIDCGEFQAAPTAEAWQKWFPILPS
jgi:DNA-binding MarR family transcriptional regulator